MSCDQAADERGAGWRRQAFDHRRYRTQRPERASDVESPLDPGQTWRQTNVIARGAWWRIGVGQSRRRTWSGRRDRPRERPAARGRRPLRSVTREPDIVAIVPRLRHSASRIAVTGRRSLGCDWIFSSAQVVFESIAL